MGLTFNIRSTTNTPDHAIHIPNASDRTDGLMSAADKVKLDGFVPGGGATLAQTYDAGSTRENQTMSIDDLHGGAVVLERNDVINATGLFFTALEIINTAEATALDQQFSPLLTLAGQAYDSQQGSVQINWAMQVRITESGESTAGDLVFSYTNAGDPVNERFRITRVLGVFRMGATAIDVRSPNDGDVLTYDSGTQSFVPSPGGGGSNTLATTYALGSSAADQTMVVTNADGGPPRVSVANIDTSATPGFYLQAGTAATALQEQYSPTFVWRGAAFDSGFSVDVDFRAQVFTQNASGGGETPATGALVFSSSIDGGPATPLFSILENAVGTVRIGSVPVQVSSAATGEVLVYNGTGFSPGAGGGFYSYRLLPNTDYVCVDGDNYLDGAAATAIRTITLPLASTGAGRLIIYAAGSGFDASVEPAGSDTINGLGFVEPAAGSVWAFVSNGVDEWRVVSVLTALPP